MLHAMFYILHVNFKKSGAILGGHIVSEFYLEEEQITSFKKALREPDLLGLTIDHLRALFHMTP